MVPIHIGRDFKLWMQVAVFVLQGITPDENLLIWEFLSEIFSFAYATGYDKRNQQAANQMVTTFVNAVRTTYPELVKKPKIHLLLHLVDDIMNLGPANGFCTERFEAFNSTIRSLNINSNRHASSLDICTKITKMERLRFVLSGGRWGEDHSLQASQLVRNLGEDHHRKIQHYLNNTPAKESMDNKAIYQSGCLRKGSYNKGKLQSRPVNQCLQYFD